MEKIIINKNRWLNFFLLLWNYDWIINFPNDKRNIKLFQRSQFCHCQVCSEGIHMLKKKLYKCSSMFHQTQENFATLSIFRVFSRYRFYSPERKISDFQDLTPSTRRNLFISLWNPFWCGEGTLKQKVSSRAWKRKDCLDCITTYDENLSIYFYLPTNFQIYHFFNNFSEILHKFIYQNISFCQSVFTFI